MSFRVRLRRQLEQGRGSSERLLAAFRTPDFLADVGSAFQAAAWHEALHIGQVTVAPRALGHDPFVLAPPRPTA